MYVKLYFDINLCQNYFLYKFSTLEKFKRFDQKDFHIRDADSMMVILSSARLVIARIQFFLLGNYNICY